MHGQNNIKFVFSEVLSTHILQLEWL